MPIAHAHARLAARMRSEFAGITLVFTSPRTDRYKEFLKAPAATTRYMPIWDLDELISCRAHLFSSVSKDLMRRLFEEWGGVPRFVLQFAHDKTQQAKLKPAIDRCVSTGLTTMASAAGEMAASTDMLSDKVFHIGTVDYETVQLRWASQYVFDEVCAAQAAAMQQQLIAFLAASTRNPTLAVLRGKLFEPYVHKLLGGGGTFEYRIVDPPLSTVHSFNFQPRSTRTFTDLSELAVEPDVYYVPTAQNFETADSFIVIGGRLHILQVSVGGSHPVLARKIKDILDTVPGDHADFVLCFVVPPDQFSDYKAQKFLTLKRRMWKRTPFRNCQQWVVKIPV
jgi:hypothetical protein